MAHMYPSTLDPDTQSGAERRLYEALARELSDDWTVFHSVRWIGTDHMGRPADGEADFVIAHPGLGVLTIEVKGGRIKIDPRTGRFVSTDRAGQQHDIGDPFKQATSSKHTLITKVRGTRDWPRQRVVFGHLVAFPDQVAEQGWTRPSAPREIIIDSLDLVSLEPRLRGALAYWRGQATTDVAPGTAGVDALVRMLAQSDCIRNPLAAEQAESDERTLIQLTASQHRYLRFLRGQRRAAIAGCAGSGKTLLAIEKASQLAAEGLRVLYTCYNRALADHIGDELGYRRHFEVRSFLQLCTYWSDAAGRPLAVREDAPEDYFRLTLPGALHRAVESLGPQYDAIVVDEGQDFRREWWDALPWLLQDPADGILYVFYDDNQRLYRDRAAIPVPGEPFVLDENCRNTRRIFDVVDSFYLGTQRPTPLGPPGQPVEIIPYASVREGQDWLRRTLHRLTSNEGFAHNQIAVLSALGTQRSSLLGRRFGNLQLTDRLPLSTGEIYATTVRRFKGLDRSAIVLCEVDKRMSQEDVETLMYVGTSRAKSYLVVLLGVDAPTAVRDALASLRPREGG